MKQAEITQKLNNLLIFNKKYLKMLEKKEDTLNANIKYWLKNKSLIALKSGSYILRSKYEKETNKDLYLEYLANQLIKPSYLSLEYVLAKYQLLSEPARSITSISTKQSRVFVNELGTWRYYTMPKRLITGYRSKSFKGQTVLEATKAKALFDFLYLRLRRSSIINIKSLRLNLENMQKKDWQEFFRYLDTMPSKKWKNLKIEIKKYA
jgi:hypothetical protein